MRLTTVNPGDPCGDHLHLGDRLIDPTGPSAMAITTLVQRCFVWNLVKDRGDRSVQTRQDTTIRTFGSQFSR